MTSAKVDAYLERSQQWPEVISALRPILLAAGLTEEIKWGKPCYTHGDKNIVILQEMKEFLSLMFFKGALLSDPDGILREQGPNSRSARRIEFVSAGDVGRRAATLRAYLDEAIAVEAAGLTVDESPELVLADELQKRLEGDADLREAFETLTPGRQREYNLYFSGAKKAETREARIDRYADKILDGKGLREQ